MNKSKSLTWDEVEKAIYKEIKWLEFSILEIDSSDRFAQETHRKYHPLAEKTD